MQSRRPNQFGQPKQSRSIVKIILTDIPTPNNRKLLRFFKDNLESLNRAGLKFEWIIASKSEKDIYTEQGITKFPALLPNPGNKQLDQNSFVFGTNTIISYLLNYNKSPNKSSMPNTDMKQNASEFDMDTYMLNQLSKNKDDEVDENDMFNSSLQSKLNNAKQKRDSFIPSKPNKSNVQNKQTKIFERGDNIDISPLGIINTNDDDNDMDTIMMKGFYENQEETEI